MSKEERLVECGGALRQAPMNRRVMLYVSALIGAVLVASGGVSLASYFFMPGDPMPAVLGYFLIIAGVLMPPLTVAGHRYFAHGRRIPLILAFSSLALGLVGALSFSSLITMPPNISNQIVSKASPLILASIILLLLSFASALLSSPESRV